MTTSIPRARRIAAQQAARIEDAVFTKGCTPHLSDETAADSSPVDSSRRLHRVFSCAGGQIEIGAEVDIDNLKATLRKFAADRDWDQFHSPKNLSMAASVEAAELLEHFQWLSEEQSYALPPDLRDLVSHEIADVLIYLVRLADKLDIDIDRAVREKLVINGLKYPADKVRGKADKSTAYQDESQT